MMARQRKCRGCVEKFCANDLSNESHQMIKHLKHERETEAEEEERDARGGGTPHSVQGTDKNPSQASSIHAHCIP